MIDVDRMIQSHGALNHAGRGRRGLGHLTRGGVLLLCAAWERYVECLLRESLAYLASKADDPTSLPESVQRTLARRVKSDKHELKALSMAGTGWRKVLHDYCDADTESLNSPNSATLDPLYKSYLGIEGISTCWSLGAASIDDFVRARGAIAHRGREADYVAITELTGYAAGVRQAARDTDGFVGDYLRDQTASRRPWNRIA